MWLIRWCGCIYYYWVLVSGCMWHCSESDWVRECAFPNSVWFSHYENNSFCCI